MTYQLARKKNKNKLATYYIYDIVKCIDNQKKIKNILKKNKIEVIFHLAADASVNSSLEKPNSILTTNFNASVAIIEACKKHLLKNLFLHLLQQYMENLNIYLLMKNINVNLKVFMGYPS